MKKRLSLLLIVALLMCLPATSQTGNSSDIDVYTVTDNPAMPIMGAKKLKALLATYVKNHPDYGGKGAESIWFVVLSDGSIGEIRPPLSLGASINIYKFNDETDLVRTLRYKPAKVGSKAVASWVTLSIPYKGEPDKNLNMTGIGALDVKGNTNGGSVYQVTRQMPKDSAKLERKVFDVVEQMPSFPGGVYYLMSYLSENVHYPLDAQLKKIQGRVIVSFIVERDGAISNPQVVQSVSPSLDAEALRVVKAMPRWVPGKQKGHGIRVKYNIPISFRLQ